jgi:hypothetical protein
MQPLQPLLLLLTLLQPTLLLLQPPQPTLQLLLRPRLRKLLTLLQPPSNSLLGMKKPACGPVFFSSDGLYGKRLSAPPLATGIKKPAIRPVLDCDDDDYFSSLFSSVRILVVVGDVSALPSLVCTDTSLTLAPGAALTSTR